MSICAKLSELPSCRIGVFDMGGVMLATEKHGRTIVLAVQRHHGKPHLVACNDEGILDADAALVVMQRICELWNAAIPTVPA